MGEPISEDEAREFQAATNAAVADTFNIKVGDGKTQWASLPYADARSRTLVTTKCRNCGAPYRRLGSHACEYCNTLNA
jgi:hypothetical protein